LTEQLTKPTLPGQEEIRRLFSNFSAGEREVLASAESLVRQTLVTGEGKLDDLLQTPPGTFLNRPDPRLDGITPISLLYQGILGQQFPGFSGAELARIVTAASKLHQAIREPDGNVFITFLDQQADRFLEEEDRRIGNQTPMQVLRAAINTGVFQTQAAIIQPAIETVSGGDVQASGFGSKPVRSRERPAITRSQVRHRVMIKDRYVPIEPVNRAGEIPPVETEAVHLSSQSAIRMDNIRAIIDSCPRLRLIQAPKSFEHMFGPGLQTILEEKRIELRFDRIRDTRHYDESALVDPNYRLKETAFTAMLGNPKKTAAYHRMVELAEDDLKFIGATVAKSYFSGDRRSLRVVAKELGLPSRRVQFEFNVFIHWLGIKSRRPGVKIKAEYLEVHLSRLQRLQRDVEERERRRQELRIGDLLPPETLPVPRWEMWHQINRLFQENPQTFEALDWDQFAALAVFYQLGSLAGTKMSLVKLGQQYRDTLVAPRQTLSLRKNRALEILGLLEVEK